MLVTWPFFSTRIIQIFLLTSQDHKDRPGEEFHHYPVALGLDPGRQIKVPHDVDGNIALQRVGDENSERQHHLHRLGQTAASKTNTHILVLFDLFSSLCALALHFGVGQIERDGAGGEVAVLQEAEQTETNVEEDDEHHGPVEHPGGAPKGHGRFHVVLQRHDLR